jgi:integrase/recombinase XerD
VEKDPTADILRPRMPRAVPRPISDADLIDALDQASPDVRAMLACAAYQGLRAKEIAGLQRDDIP